MIEEILKTKPNFEPLDIDKYHSEHLTTIGIDRLMELSRTYDIYQIKTLDGGGGYIQEVCIYPKEEPIEEIKPSAKDGYLVYVRNNLFKVKTYSEIAESNISYYLHLEQQNKGTALEHIYRAKKEANAFWLGKMQSEVITIQEWLIENKQ